MTHLVSIWENAAELTTAGTLTWWQPPKQNKRGHQRWNGWKGWKG